MQLRPGGTYRIYDGEKWHVAIGGNYVCDGSHRQFQVRVWKGKGRGYIGGGPDFTVTIPKLSFKRAYKLRRIGGLAVWRFQGHVLRWFAYRP